MKLSELASLLCTDAYGLAAFANRGQNDLLTDAEAQDISTAWVTEGKTVTLAELTKRFGLPDDKQDGVYAWTNAHGAPGDVRWTEAEAAELLEVWTDTASISMPFVSNVDGDTETAQVEYHAEGGETVHE